MTDGYPQVAAASVSGRDVAPLKSGEHIPALDGLRGLAIIAVLLYHFGVGLAFIGFEDNYIVRTMMVGWAGVDLFFVLSGFLITGILYDAKPDAYYFRNFYMRRTLRIFPIYFLCIVLVYIAVQILPPLNNAENDGFIYPLTFTTNLAVAFNADWYEVPVVLAHYWSLAIEEQFYLVWPAVVLITPRHWLVRITLTMIAAAFALRIAMTLSGIDSSVIFTLTLARCDALAVGAFCALAMRDPKEMRSLVKIAPWAAGFAFGILLAIAVTTGNLDANSSAVQTVGFSALCIGSGAILVMTFSVRTLNRALSAPVLRWFGRYSYGTYVWHYPIYYVCFEIGTLQHLLGIRSDWSGLAYVAAAAGASVVCGYASYHIIEKRFLALKVHFEPKVVQP